MNWPEMNFQQGKELARFLHQLRPDWDKPGIEHALGKARSLGSGPDVAIAAIKAATKASNRTPAVIPLQGEHWRTTGPEVAPRRPPLTPSERCTVCSQAEPRCRQLAALPGDGHEFTPSTPVEQRGVALNEATGELIQIDPTPGLERVRQVVTTHTQEKAS